MKESEKTRELIERMELFKEDAYKVFSNRPKETRVNTYRLVEETGKIGLAGVIINPNYENNTCVMRFKHGTMEKVIKKCILPIFKDHNLDVEHQLALLDLTKGDKKRQYDISKLRYKLNIFLQKAIKNNKNEVKSILKEIDYVISDVSVRKLEALENKQKREERKCIKVATEKIN